MSIKKTLVRNISWNWAGTVFDTAVAFAVTPYLVKQLGETPYGLWILLGSFTSYFGLLDFGIRGSVGRFLAFYNAEGRKAEVNAVFNTALAICTAVGAVKLRV